VINTYHGDTWLSTDGTNWTQVASAPADHIDHLYAFDGGYLLSKQDGTHQYSTDGIEWEEVSAPPGGELIDTAFGYFMEYESQIWWSANGTDWKPVGPEFVTGESAIAIIASANRIVALTEDESWYSDDGTNWTPINGPQLGVLFPRRGSEIGFVGIRSGGDHRELWFSEDGISWLLVPPQGEQPPDSLQWARGIIAIPNGFLMYGRGDSDATIWIYQR
jgi:hypothetical protein